MNPHVAVVIPARLESVRLPRKLLRADTGKPLIQHTYENACRASLPREVLIAADSEEILRAVAPFGSRAVLTRCDHRSGTDRIAEAAEKLDASVIVNVQGDEPEMPPSVIDAVAEVLLSEKDVRMATAAVPLPRGKETDPSCVKVVLDREGYALYFSRAPIPFKREREEDYAFPPLLHLGIYAYRRDFLAAFTALPPGRLERTEKLEQLRALEHGYRIKVVTTESVGVGIDTEEDYRNFVARCRKREEIP